MSTEPVPHDAAAGLRAALLAGSGVAGAVRQTFNQDPEFGSALLATAAQQRFGPHCDIRQITSLMARIRTDQPEFPAREAEQAIRWMLGEARLGPEIGWAAVDFDETFALVLSRLFREWQPDDAMVADLLASAASTLAGELASPHRWMLIRRAELHRHAGRLELAIADYDRAIELDPDDPWVLTKRGVTHLGLGHRAEMRRDFRRAAELDPASKASVELLLGHPVDDVEAENRDAAPILDQSEADTAEDLALYGHILADDPDNDEALACRAFLYSAMGRHFEALADATRAIQLNPDHSLAAFSRAVSLSNLGRYDEALAAYDQAARLDPDNPGPPSGRGVIRQSQHRYDEALTEFNLALELDPLAPISFTNRAAIYTELRRYDDALLDLRRAAELGHADPGWLAGARAEVYRLMGRYEDALADFTEAIDQDDTDAEALAGRGRTYLAMGRDDEARDDLSRAIQLDPEAAEDLGAQLAGLEGKDAPLA